MGICRLVVEIGVLACSSSKSSSLRDHLRVSGRTLDNSGVGVDLYFISKVLQSRTGVKQLTPGRVALSIYLHATASICALSS